MNALRLVQIQKLDELYARIPPVVCKPGCADCCGPVLMSKVEWLRITEYRGGIPPEGDAQIYLTMKKGSLSCSLLGPDNRCTVYPVRPAVCRIFATTTDPLLWCPHGARPDKLMNERDCRALLRTANVVGS